jgi:hypothetical protein
MTTWQPDPALIALVAGYLRGKFSGDNEHELTRDIPGLIFAARDGRRLKVNKAFFDEGDDHSIAIYLPANDVADVMAKGGAEGITVLLGIGVPPVPPAAPPPGSLTVHQANLHRRIRATIYRWW